MLKTDNYEKFKDIAPCRNRSEFIRKTDAPPTGHADHGKNKRQDVTTM